MPVQINEKVKKLLGVLPIGQKVLIEESLKTNYAVGRADALKELKLPESGSVLKTRSGDKVEVIGGNWYLNDRYLGGSNELTLSWCRGELEVIK